MTETVELELTTVQEQLLESIRAYYGHENWSETAGYLISQEARRLVRGGQPLMDVRSIVQGYLGGVVTAREAMQALSVYDGLMPGV